MTPDTLLNLLWLLTVVGAIAVWGVTELRRSNPSTFRARMRRGVAVLAATVALFPALSASDDVVSLRQLQPSCQVQNPVTVTARTLPNPGPGGEAFGATVGSCRKLLPHSCEPPGFCCCISRVHLSFTRALL